MKPEELRELFRSFEHSVFRLEALDRYSVGAEDEDYLRWSRGEAPPPIDGDWWFDDVVRAATSSGKRWERVHMIRLPLTDYLRFEFEYEYPSLEAAGDRCHILEVTQGDDPPLPPEDFWLFDDRLAVRMDYDSDGRLMDRVAFSDDASVSELCRRRDLALSLATRFPIWLSQARGAGRI